MTELSTRGYGLALIREPDDTLADVRISLGEKRGTGVYCVFRGDPEAVAALLRQAAAGVATAIERGHYTDRRGRPRG